jgi:hypothetical protein
VLCFVASLVCGHLSKGALIQAMIIYATAEKWTFPELASLFNSFQVFAVTAGLLVFIFCFFFYSRELARLLVRENP